MKRLLILLALVGCGGDREYQHVEPAPQDYLHQAVVTVEQFDKVTNGMTVEEVTRIMGRDGETIAVKSGIEHVWNNPDGTMVSVRFVDGKSVEKVRMGKY